MNGLFGWLRIITRTTPFPGAFFWWSIEPANLDSFGMVERDDGDDSSMTFQLKAMSGAVALGQAVDVYAPFHGTLNPFPILFIAVRKVMGCMFGFRKDIQVFNHIVGMVMVLVMDMKGFFVFTVTGWHRAVVLLPKPNVVGLTVAILGPLALRGFQGFERVAGSLAPLVMKRTQSACMVWIRAAFDSAKWFLFSVHGVNCSSRMFNSQSISNQHLAGVTSSLTRHVD